MVHRAALNELSSDSHPAIHLNVFYIRFDSSVFTSEINNVKGKDKVSKVSDINTDCKETVPMDEYYNIKWQGDLCAGQLCSIFSFIFSLFLSFQLDL